jgi:hypothetical protein
MNRTLTQIAIAIAIAPAALSAAQAEVRPEWCHPATLARHADRPAMPGIDANTFIVAHPAGLALVHGHANYEHPAVVIARASQPSRIDANTFIVQPPTTVSWTLESEATDTTRVAMRQGSKAGTH